MKLNFSQNQKKVGRGNSLRPENIRGCPPLNSTFNFQLSTFNSSQSGIALVIPHIHLSVTLVMAIAFLAVSRRERNSATLSTDSTVAQFADDSALAQAEGRIISQILTTTNPYISSLIVSTNYINQLGFNPGVSDPTNVNYDYRFESSTPLATADIEQNIANLYYSPRPPVYFSNDFRFYLYLNRNGRFDTNGVVTNFDNNLNGLGTTTPNAIGDPEWIGVLEHPDAPHGPNNHFIARYCFIAVPANSLDLNYIHNQALDVTAAYSGGGNVLGNPAGKDAYSRDQGVGTWEINLAAFLTDLNTNRWDPPTIWNNASESYSFPGASINGSAAFDDARSLIAWRYNFSYPMLETADNMFGGPSGWGDSAFKNNGIDYYSIGQQSTFDTNYYFGTPNYSGGNPTFNWVGAANTNVFFSSPSELFIPPSPASTTFSNNLYSAGTNNSTYDRYTFYRMLAQIGTDTLPESGKINLNYANAVVNYDFNGLPTAITIVPNIETNFLSWQPLNFFTAAANQLLKAYTVAWYESSPTNYIYSYYGIPDQLSYTNFNLDGVGVTNIQYFGQTNQIPSFGITNIPVYVNGRFVYTAAVNRLLQLAANIYDASTNTANVTLGLSNYPSVFRPVFWVTNELNPNNSYQVDVYIKGYQYVQEPLTASSPNLFFPPIEVTDPSLMSLAPSPRSGGISTSNVWGVPWIIGAKKGLPNFNGLEVDNTFLVERLLQFHRQNANVYPSGTSPAVIAAGRGVTTNQMYMMSVINTFGIEDWNSYGTAYQNNINVLAQENFGFALSNLDNLSASQAQVKNPFFTNNFLNGTPVQPWYGNPWPSTTPSTASFIFPLGTNTVVQNLGPAGLPASTNGVYTYFFGSSVPSVTLNGFTYNAPCFIPNSANPPPYIDQGTPPLPHMVMMTTNRVQAWMLDQRNPSAPYILDYVQLGGMDSSLDVNQTILLKDQVGLWNTNSMAGGQPTSINQQILISSGSTGVNPPTYAPWSPSTDSSYNQEVANFNAFFSYDNQAIYNGTLANPNPLTNLMVQAPYTAMVPILQRFVYQANDPLVHYMSSDLADIADMTTNTINLPSIQSAFQTVAASNRTLQVLNRVSDRYAPWGTLGRSLTSPNLSTYSLDKNQYNLSYKDPLVNSSDNWDFPSYKYPNIGWLGRVHRGTPWQTVFLKSTNIWSLTTIGNGISPTGPNSWLIWTGNFYNQDDAYNETPVWDRLLFDLFTATPNDDATRGRLSVNIGADNPTDPLAGLASWSALFSGIVAVNDNNASDDPILSFTKPVQYPLPSETGINTYSSYLTNQPYGSFYNGGIPTNSTLWRIVTGINAQRALTTNIDGLTNVFEHVGDILSVPQLSDASPFLNSADTFQQQYGISDEMYEWLPQNVMSLLTVSGTPQSPPRYVVYCYGQTLKSAPNGIVESSANGQIFGLVTNYQVTAESASRAVIRIVNTPTPANPTATPRVVIEQYNPLPPD